MYRGENRESVLVRHQLGVEHALTRLTLESSKLLPTADLTAIIVGHGSSLRTLLNHYKPGSKLHEQGGYDLVELP
jgi:broad specificity phosphatase PhoE